jgi:CHAT domain-containing protein
LFFLRSGILLHAQSAIAPQAKFDSLYKINEISAAIPLGETIIENGLKSGVTDTVVFSRSLIRLLNCYNTSRMPEKSATIIPVAFRFTRPNTLGHAVLMKSTADWTAYTSRQELADSIFEAAIAEYKLLGKDRTQLGFQCLSSAVDNKLTLGFLDEAEALLTETLDYCTATGTMPDENLPFAMGRLLVIQGRHTKALPYLEKGISMLSPKYPPGAPNLVYKKNVYIPLLAQEGHYFKADSMLQQLLVDVEKYSGEQSYDYAYTLRTYGIIRANTGDFKTAEKYLKQACDITATIAGKSDRRYLDNAVYLANNYLSQDKMAEARELVTPIQDAYYLENNFAAEEEAELFSLLAACSKTTAEEIGFLKKTVAVFQKYSGKSWCGNHANEMINLVQALLKDQQYPEAMATLNQMAEMEQEIAETNVIFTEYLYCRAITATYTGEKEMALSCWNRVIDIQAKSFFESVFFLNESSRTDRLNYLNNISGTLLGLARQYPFLSATAMNLQLLNKSLLLSADQKIRQNIQADVALAPIFGEWTDARERLAWCYSQSKSDLVAQRINVVATEVKADSLEKMLIRKRAGFVAASIQNNENWQDIQQKLQPGEAAIAMTRFSDHQLEWKDTVRYAVFVLQYGKEQPQVVFLPNGDRVEQILVEQYLSECAVATGNGQTGELYQAFWLKIEPCLKGVSRIWFSADGAFFKINPGAILLPSGEYVADRYEVRNVFSLKDIGKDKETRGIDNYHHKTAFLAGNPAFLTKNEAIVATSRSVTAPTDSLQQSNLSSNLREFNETRGLTLSPLPGSELEVNDIAALLRKKGWQTTVATGTEANEELVKAQTNPTILHLSTHGYFLANIKSGTAGLSRRVLENNPMLRSMVFFAGAQNTLDKKPMGKEDGILSAYEAQNLHLEGTELVVLSACKSALGQIQNGEGVYGLQRALRIAGAKAVIISLWDVDDKVGREFMLFFYKKWLDGASKAEAFRAAQLAIKKKHPLPFYWAGFVLME